MAKRPTAKSKQRPKPAAASKLKAARVARTDRKVPGADGLKGLDDNSKRSKLSFDDEQALFLRHRSPWLAAHAAVAVAEKRIADVVAALKSDGFTKKQFQIADDLGKPKGEARVVSEVNDRIKVARFIGHPMGAQLDLFGSPENPKVKALTLDDCYAEGKRCSMENKAGKPPAHYAAEQVQSFMSGFHDHQRELGGGIKAPGTRDGSVLAHREQG